MYPLSVTPAIGPTNEGTTRHRSPYARVLRSSQGMNPGEPSTAMTSTLAAAPRQATAVSPTLAPRSTTSIRSAVAARSAMSCSA
jgi:hypothetical protein